MRDILCHGKAVHSGEWVEGDLSHHKTGKVFIKPIGGSATSSVEVFPESVGLYTTFDDNNGKRIYEGDIISVTRDTYRSPKETFIGEVFWALAQFNVSIFPCEAVEEILADCVVIGNVFDNPELLKGDSQNNK